MNSNNKQAPQERPAQDEQLPPELLASLEQGNQNADEPPTNEGEDPDPREHQ